MMPPSDAPHRESLERLGHGPEALSGQQGSEAFSYQESPVVVPMLQSTSLPSISETAPANTFGDTLDTTGRCIVTFPLEVPQRKASRFSEKSSEEHASRKLANQAIEDQIARLGQQLEAHLSCCVKEQTTVAAAEASSEALAAAHTEVTAAVSSERRQREDALMALQRDLLTLTDSAVRERGLIEELYKEVEALRGEHEAVTRAVSSACGSTSAGASAVGSTSSPCLSASSGSGAGSAGRLLEETRRLLADFEACAMRDLNARFEVLQGQAMEALTGIASQKDMLASKIEQSVAELCAALTLQQQEEMQRLRQQLRSEMQQLVDASSSPRSTATVLTSAAELFAGADAEAAAKEGVSEKSTQQTPFLDLKLQVASLQQEMEQLQKFCGACPGTADASAGGPALGRELKAPPLEAKAQVASCARSTAAVNIGIVSQDSLHADTPLDMVVLQNLRQLQQQLFEQFAEIEAERDARMRDSEDIRSVIKELRNASTISGGADAECRWSSLAAEVEELRTLEHRRVGELCAQALAGWEEGQTENVVLLEQGLASVRNTLGGHMADAQDKFAESAAMIRAEQEERQQNIAELQSIVTDSCQRLELLESDYIDVTRTLKRLDIKVRDLPRRHMSMANVHQVSSARSPENASYHSGRLHRSASESLTNEPSVDSEDWLLADLAESSLTTRAQEAARQMLLARTAPPATLRTGASSRSPPRS